MMKSSTLQSCLLESFNAHGDWIAIEYGENAVSYSLLAKRSSFIANLITEKGIKTGSFIGIFIENRSHFIAVLIGILRARCVFVPLDPLLPVKRIRQMLQITGTRTLFLNAEQLRYLQTNGMDIEKNLDTALLIDDFAGEWNEYSPDHCTPTPLIKATNPDYQPGDQVYIYFTSGSTDIPKAILGKNISVLHYVDWEINTFRVNEKYRVSQLMAIGFDAFLRDIFVPLFCGGTVCIPLHQEIVWSGKKGIQWFERSGINLIHTVPSLFRLLCRHQLESKNFTQLKYILLSGEKIKAHELENWYNTFGERIQLVNQYGPTETTMVKTYYFIKKQDIRRGKIPIGKPMKGAQLILFENDMNICSQGITGEIYIRTPYRTFGYYNNDDLNKQFFIPNPLTGDINDLLYRTGDLGIEKTDGNFECLGRIDRQVKIQGIRIEPGEIERVLQDHPDIIEAVVVPMEGDNGNRFLSAFLVSAKRLEKSRVRQYLFSLLPPYIIPGYIIQTERIPLLPNGKVDVKNLKEIFYREQRKNKYKEPRNNAEKKLVEIWKEILKIEKVGIADDFFQLGGQSLGVLRLVAEVKRVFEIEITLGELLEHTQLESLAEYIVLRGMGASVEVHPEEPFVIFNRDSSRNLFVFPTQLAYGITYKELSQLLSDHVIYAFNFLEEENWIGHCADLIKGIQEKDPYQFLGYSAGGNLAFEAAREIEQRGGQVSDIIIVDSFSKPVNYRLGTQEAMEEFYSNIGNSIEQMGLGFLKEKVFDKSRRLAHYFQDLITRGKVKARLHLITSTNREERQKYINITGPCKQGMSLDVGWEAYTSAGYFTYTGFGKHIEMLNPGLVEKNAEIIKKILNYPDQPDAPGEEKFNFLREASQEQIDIRSLL